MMHGQKNIKLHNKVPHNKQLFMKQTLGDIFCLPTTTRPRSVQTIDQSITFINTDYKISQWLNIIEVATGIRDTNATVELMHKPINRVSLDFTSAIDRISHCYIQYSQGP